MISYIDPSKFKVKKQKYSNYLIKLERKFKNKLLKIYFEIKKNNPYKCRKYTLGNHFTGLL